MKRYSALLHRAPAFFIAILLFSITSYSQKKEVSGYYITLQGDTIPGLFTDYRQWSRNPANVAFVSAREGKPVTLTPSNCSSFSVDKYDQYLSYTGKRITNSLDYAAASFEDGSITYDTISTFLRQVAETEAYRFYVYNGKERINLFYTSRSKEPIELIQRLVVTDNIVAESMQYIQQLKGLFINKIDAATIEKVNFIEDGLVDLVNKINRGSRYQTNLEKPDDGVVIVAGASYNSFKFSGDRTSDFTSANYKSNVVPVVGIGYIVTLKRNFGKVFLLPLLKIYAHKHSSLYSSPGSSAAVKSTFKSAAIITFTLQGGYNFINKAGLKAFIGPGMGMSMFAKNEYTREAFYGANKSKMIGISYVLDVHAGVIAQKKYVVWASYSFPTPTTNFVITSGNLSSLQIGVGYKLL